MFNFPSPSPLNPRASYCSADCPEPEMVYAATGATALFPGRSASIAIDFRSPALITSFSIRLFGHAEDEEQIPYVKSLKVDGRDMFILPLPIMLFDQVIQTLAGSQRVGRRVELKIWSPRPIRSRVYALVRRRRSNTVRLVAKPPRVAFTISSLETRGSS